MRVTWSRVSLYMVISIDADFKLNQSFAWFRSHCFENKLCIRFINLYVFLEVQIAHRYISADNFCSKLLKLNSTKTVSNCIF